MLKGLTQARCGCVLHCWEWQRRICFSTKPNDTATLTIAQRGTESEASLGQLQKASFSPHKLQSSPAVFKSQALLMCTAECVPDRLGVILRLHCKPAQMPLVAVWSFTQSKSSTHVCNSLHCVRQHLGFNLRVGRLQ